MSKAKVVEIESDDEPQPKKLKQERSPLVVINGETHTKKRQLTLKDMVSPKTKPSKFKVLASPKLGKSPVSNNSSQEKGTSKTDSVAEINKIENLLTTTPNRGVKRKATGGEAGQKTPVKQQKIPSIPVKAAEAKDTNEVTGPIKSDAPTRKTASKKKHSKDTSKSDKTVSPVSNKSDKSKEIDNKETSKTPVRKPTLESMLIRKTPQRPPVIPPPEKESKGDDKTPQNLEKIESLNEANETLTVKLPKKRFGDYKRTKSGEALPKVKNTGKFGVVNIDEACRGTNSEVIEKKGTETEKEIELEGDNVVGSANDSVIPTSNSESVEPILGAHLELGKAIKEAHLEPVNTIKKSEYESMDTSDDITTIDLEGEIEELQEKDEPTDESTVFHVDGERAGPSGVSSKSTATAKKAKPLSLKQKRLQEERDNKKREIADEKEKKRLEREKEKEVRDESKRAEQAKKDEEKHKKEEERKLREEEKKQKDEEKRVKDAEKDAEKKRKLLEEEDEKRFKEEKRLKEQEKFKSFFVVKKPNVLASTPKMEAIEKKFRDFVITPSMAVAPITRTTPVTGDILSADAVTWDSNLLHIRIVISEMSAKHKLCTDDLSDDLEIISLDPKQVKVKRKILHFHENHRPAYCGSWRKTSDVIRPRRPFGQDKTLLEYEYDSDDDWEEEEEGEDIETEKEDDKEEEKEKEDNDDEDDGFFVPHGYLSDDEGDEDCTDMTEEAKQKRIDRRREQFEEEQTSKESGILKAKIIGPVWQTESPPSNAAQYLSEFNAVWKTDSADQPFDPFSRIQPVAQLSEGTSKNDKQALPVAGYGMLIRFLHGSPIGMSRGVEKFQEQWHSDESRGKVSKRQLTQLIPTLVKKCMRPGNIMKLCWYASDEVLEKYSLSDLIGLHCEEPPELQLPPPASKTKSLLEFTKITSAEQDLAILKQQMALQEAQQKQQLALQQALILAVRQQETLKAEAVQKSQLNTIKNFLASSNTVKRVPLIPLNSNVGNGVINLNDINNSNRIGTSFHSNNGNYLSSPVVTKPVVSSQSSSGGTPRRISLVPVTFQNSSSTTPINIDDDSK